MKHSLLLGMSAILVLIASPVLHATDCVGLDVELTPEVTAGGTGEGSFELTNCGDVAGTIMLSVAFQIPDGPTIEVADIPVKLAAGEIVAQSFTYPAPHLLIGYTFGICATAVLGEASAHDCASTTIIDNASANEGGRENFGIGLALVDDCLEMDIELTDVIYTSQADLPAEAYFELTNCGDDNADVSLKLDIKGYTLSSNSTQVIQVGAGETISRKWSFAVPSYIPSGVYNICVTATAGTAITTDCETVEVRSTPPTSGSDPAISGVSNFPNPFNPETQIEFVLKDDANVSIDVVNLLGQRIRSLVDARPMKAGEQQIAWDGRDDADQPVSSGIYFYRIIADNQAVSEKMVLVK